MPRKKAEPEVLQEETVQPEIAQVEETVTAEQPALEPQVEEPAITEPVQPYGEDDVPAAAEKSESSEPEKKSFYDLDFRALDQDLSRSSGRSGTRSTPLSAAEASCAARSSASIRTP